MVSRSQGRQIVVIVIQALSESEARQWTRYGIRKARGGTMACGSLQPLHSVLALSLHIIQGGIVE